MDYFKDFSRPGTHEPHHEKTGFLPRRRQKRRSRLFFFATKTVQVLYLSTNFKIQAFFCSYTGRFLSELVENAEDGFSRVEAHIYTENKKKILYHPLFVIYFVRFAANSMQKKKKCIIIQILEVVA